MHVITIQLLHFSSPERGALFDFRINGGHEIVLDKEHGGPTTNISADIRSDNVALEVIEDFTLTLSKTKSSHPYNALNNVLFVQTLHVFIEDKTSELHIYVAVITY